ncbi:hypothetical protein DSC45_29325 [Streptomyces sp. YIM 130001]|nr:hypothetical protein DSC45_29325 [Streptomyces sp. YIM 130001]
MTGRGTGRIWLLHTGNPHRWRPGSGSGVQKTACEPDGHQPAARAGASRTKIRTTPPPFVGGVRGRRSNGAARPSPRDARAAGLLGGHSTGAGLVSVVVARIQVSRRRHRTAATVHVTTSPATGPMDAPCPRASDRLGEVRLLAGEEEAARPAWPPAPSRPVARNGSPVAGPGSTRRDSTGTTAGVAACRGEGIDRSRRSTQTAGRRRSSATIRRPPRPRRGTPCASAGSRDRPRCTQSSRASCGRPVRLDGPSGSVRHTAVDVSTLPSGRRAGVLQERLRLGWQPQAVRTTVNRATRNSTPWKRSSSPTKQGTRSWLLAGTIVLDVVAGAPQQRAGRTVPAGSRSSG